MPAPYNQRSPARDFDEARRRYPHWPSVLAEGDSWFSHPFERNILYHLADFGDYAIRRLGAPGDTLANMLLEAPDRRPQYLRQLRRERFQWKYLLLSGGGNDLLGAPLPNLLEYRAQVTGWQDAIKKSVLDGELEKLRGWYTLALRRMKEARPDCRLLVHGYDYAVPRPHGAAIFWGAITVSGPWMWPIFQERGIADETERRSIVRLLIDRLNDEVLAPLAASDERFQYIDLRGTLGAPGEWDDEIHPKTAGFLKMAKAIKKKLDRLERDS